MEHDNCAAAATALPPTSDNLWSESSDGDSVPGMSSDSDNGSLDLPYLVLFGDQSSGKTSVVEALTGIALPHHATLGTCFAVELVLHCSDNITATVQIKPSVRRNAAARHRLLAWREHTSSLADLPRLVEVATRAMFQDKPPGLGALSADVLRVWVTSPDVPELTLVDLPGLFHSATKNLTEVDRALANELTRTYLDNPCAIYMPVLSAKSNVATQVALSLVRQHRYKGAMTLGIVTKPDYILSRAARDTWFDVLWNEDTYLEHGWHMLRNRSDNEAMATLEERNATEMAFFRGTYFGHLPIDLVGAATLRERVNKVKLHCLLQQLPRLSGHLFDRLDECVEDIQECCGRTQGACEERQHLREQTTDLAASATSLLATMLTAEFTSAINNLADPVNEDRHIQSMTAGLQSRLDALHNALLLLE